jgi:uncharacterized membrane protein
MKFPWKLKNAALQNACAVCHTAQKNTVFWHFTPPKRHFVTKWFSSRLANSTFQSPIHTTVTSTMQLTPVIAIHMTAALGALVIGPVALWARRSPALGQSNRQRPRLHRAAGYAWVTLMLMTALSALFIRDFRFPNLAGFTPIHLFVPYTLIGLFIAFRALLQGNIAGHRKAMLRQYFGACVAAGVFTLLPGRYLGQLVWGQWFGLL